MVVVAGSAHYTDPTSGSSFDVWCLTFDVDVDPDPELDKIRIQVLWPGLNASKTEWAGVYGCQENNYGGAAEDDVCTDTNYWMEETWQRMVPWAPPKFYWLLELIDKFLIDISIYWSMGSMFDQVTNET